MGIVFLPGAVNHFLLELLQIFFAPTGRHRFGGGNGLFSNRAWMFAGTQTTSSAIRLEMVFPLQPRTFGAPVVSERFAKKETMQKMLELIFQSQRHH